MAKDWGQLSRRSFLAGAAAAFGIPAIVPASVFASPKSVPPGDRITVGFIGCGKMANDYHLPTLLGFKDVQALAVCDVDTNRRKHAKQRVEEAYSKDER